MNRLKEIDLFITFIPFVCICTLCVLFALYPESSTQVLATLRSFFGEQFTAYYLILGLAVVIMTIYMACSKYGDIRLGGEKPRYTNFQWGSMMFTAGLAADILFYSLGEWMLYAQDSHVLEMGSVQDWASTYPLFHWGPVPWGFYIVLAVPFGFMLNVRKRTRQKYSEACRPLLGSKVDGLAGKLIDLVAVFALIAGTATTFTVATPLLSSSIAYVFGVETSTAMTIVILIVTCALYTLCTMLGIKGISALASSCTYCFFALLLYVFLGGGYARYIIETGLTALGHVFGNFIQLATYTDPLRETNFPQNWTVFYWAYWMVWCVASPFFIGMISHGRTIRQTVIGGYVCGLAGTYVSFIVLGNYGLGLQMHGKLSLIGNGQELVDNIMSILATLPAPQILCILLAITMVAFYATSFDSIAMVAASYSCKNLANDVEPSGGIKLFWSILLILLPVALLFCEASMSNLQTVSIIAAFPIGVIMILIIWSFFKDAREYMKGR